MTTAISYEELRKLVIFYQRNGVMAVGMGAFENNPKPTRYTQGSVSNYEGVAKHVPNAYIEFLFDGDWDEFERVRDMLIRTFDLMEVHYPTENLPKVKEWIIERFELKRKQHGKVPKADPLAEAHKTIEERDAQLARSEKIIAHLRQVMKCFAETQKSRHADSAVDILKFEAEMNETI